MSTPYVVELSAPVDRKIRRIAKVVPRTADARRFWNDLKKLLEWLANEPLEIGELCFEYKQPRLENRLGIRDVFAMQFAVSVENKAVFLLKLSLLENHPYPPMIADILHEEA